MKKWVYFYVGYEVEAETDEEAIDLADEKFAEEADKGWLNFDTLVEDEKSVDE